VLAGAHGTAHAEACVVAAGHWRCADDSVLRTLLRTIHAGHHVDVQSLTVLLISPLQGQTGKYFFVVQTGTFALKLPAKQPEHAGDQGAPEQTVSFIVPNPLNPEPYAGGGSSGWACLSSSRCGVCTASAHRTRCSHTCK
jgi:hypothetical protein